MHRTALALLLLLSACGAPEPTPSSPPATAEQPAFVAASTELPKAAPVAAAGGPLEPAGQPLPPLPARVPATELPAVKDRLSVLVDVRTAGEFAGGHVPGAINLPIQELGSRTAELGGHKDGVVGVICAVGGRSRAAQARLREAGYNVVDFPGGTNAYAGAGHPLER